MGVRTGLGRLSRVARGVEYANEFRICLDAWSPYQSGIWELAAANGFAAEMVGLG